MVWSFLLRCFPKLVSECRSVYGSVCHDPLWRKYQLAILQCLYRRSIQACISIGARLQCLVDLVVAVPKHAADTERDSHALTVVNLVRLKEARMCSQAKRERNTHKSMLHLVFYSCSSTLDLSFFSDARHAKIVFKASVTKTTDNVAIQEPKLLICKSYTADFE